jgi:hypothetical protein
MQIPVSSAWATVAAVSASPIAATVGRQPHLRFGLDRQHRGVRHQQSEQVTHQFAGPR